MKKRDEILMELKEIGVEVQHFSAENPYQVPVGYFEQFAESMLFRVQAEKGILPSEELETLSPLLAKIGREMPFAIPEGYFEQLSSKNINARTEPAKVIKVSFGKRAVRYAVAAAVIALMATGAWMFLKPAASDKPQLATTEDLMKDVQNISDGEMNAFLEGSTSGITYPANAEPATEIANEDIKLLLADVSDEELKHYAENADIEIQVLN